MRMTRRRRKDQRSIEAKKRSLHTAVMGGMIAMMAAPAYAVPANDALPSGGQFMGQSAGSILASNGVMDVNQFTQNAAIKWDNFNVGANATVNFNYNNSMDGAYRVLNFSENGGLPSEIFGRMKAGAQADVWLVNPNGVLIGKGAQIDVGYLHLASHNMTDEMLRSTISGNASIKAILDGSPETHTPGELMSLGNLYVNQVTFDGDRVVVDFDKLHTFSGKRVQLGEEGYLDAAGNAHVNFDQTTGHGTGAYAEGVYISEKDGNPLGFDSRNLVNNTTDFAKKADAGITTYLNGGEHTNYLEIGDHAREVVAGYSVYDKNAIGAHGSKGTYENSGKWRGIYATLANLDNSNGQFTSKDSAERVGFAWVEDSTQLERIGEGTKTLARDFALKDGIAAVNTREMNYDAATHSYKGFKPIGYDTHGTTTADTAAFTGKFDGLGYDIYGLTINRPDENDVALFGSTDGAIIRNVSLVSGSIVGNTDVGGIVGHGINTKIENVRNSARVLGVENVGGIAGYLGGTKNEQGNFVAGTGSTLDGGYNAALIRGNQNVSGLVGKLENSEIIGNTYNTGTVRGITNFKLEDPDYRTKSADDLTQAIYAVDNKNKVGSLITGYTTTNKNIYNGGATVAQSDINQSTAKDYYITSVDMTKFTFTKKNADGSLTAETLSWAGLSADDKKLVQDAISTGDGFKPGSQFTYGGNTYVISDMATGGLRVQATDGMGGATGAAFDVSLNKTVDPLAGHDAFKYDLFIIDNSQTRILMGGGSANVGGIAGYAKDSAIGNSANLPAAWGDRENKFYNGVSDYLKDKVYNTFQIYNGADVRGGNTVGGIVGSSVNSDMQNLRNEGNILAAGFKMSDDYIYSTRDYNTSAAQRTWNDRTAGSTNIANVGGIVGEATGSTITDVENEGDVTTDTDIKRQVAVLTINTDNSYGLDTSTVRDTEYYVGGNVGGIAGSITGTTITGATNTENKVFGAHNVGGIVGMMSSSHVNDSMNDGGRVIGTGAVRGENVVGTVTLDKTYTSFDNTVRENVVELYKNQQPIRDGSTYIIGNVGGIAGYMYDNPSGTDDTFSSLKDVRNRGDVSPQELYNEKRTNEIYDVNMGVNIGGIVGKVVQQRDQHANTLSVLNNITSNSSLTSDETKKQMLNALQGKDANGNDLSIYVGSTEHKINGALISGAANTGSVRGFNGVGGVAGQVMYATVANSYNIGNVGAGAAITSSAGSTATNIGGVIGEATGAEEGNQTLYDNKRPGDYGAYVYNVYNSGIVGDNQYKLYGRHMGGVIGRLAGTLESSYNTGDVYNASDTTGGVVGYVAGGDVNNVFNAGNVTVSTRPGATNEIAVGGVVSTAYGVNIKNAYNLGVIRSFNNRVAVVGDQNKVAGILVRQYGGTVNIDNVYTTGELGAYRVTNTLPTKADGTLDFDKFKYDTFNYEKNGDVYAVSPFASRNAYLIRPADAPNNNYNNSAYNSPTGPVTAVIQYNDRYDVTKYQGFDFAGTVEYVEPSADVLDFIEFLKEQGNTDEDLQVFYNAQGLVLVNGELREVRNRPEYKYTDTKMQSGDDSHEWRMYQYDDVTGKSLYRDAQGNYNDADGNLVYAHDGDLSHIRATLPTLNAIAPGGYMYYKPYDATAPEGQKGHEDILYTQIGNEYNPVTTFVQLRDGHDTLNLDFLGLAAISSPGARDGIVVNSGNLNITNVASDAFFSGVYGATGKVNVEAATGTLNIASDAAIYGKDVALKNTTGDINLLGNIYAYDGDVTLKGKNVDIFGSVLSGSKYYSDIPAGSTTQPLYWPDGTPLINTVTDDGGNKHYFAEIQDTGRTVDHGESYQAIMRTAGQNDADYANAQKAAVWNPNKAIHNKSYLYQKSLEITNEAPGDIVISTDLTYDKKQTVRPNVDDGKINLSFGNGGTGRVRTDGNLTLVAKDVEVDSDISVGLTSTGSVFKIIADNSIFDVSNIGSFGNAGGVFQTPEEAKQAKIRLLMFMAHFTGDKNASGTQGSNLHNRLEFEAVDGGKADAKLALNMYGGYDADGNRLGDDELNLKKYNFTEADFSAPGGDTYKNAYNKITGEAIDPYSESALFEFLTLLNVYNGTGEIEVDGVKKDLKDIRVAQQYSYTNIQNAEQLKNIQTYMTEKNSTVPMHLNWLLRKNIDASDITDFHTLGAGLTEGGQPVEFTGKFNGNGYDLNSLTVHDTANNVGLFTAIGATGIVSDLNINASRLEGNGTRIGLIAGTNKGVIDTVKTFGNTVKDNEKYVSSDPHFIGGLVGINHTTGFINNVSVEDIVFSERSTGLADVGGISGLNAGIIYQTTGKSDVSVADGGATSLGGITGVNAGILGSVYATGVTNGLYDRTMTSTGDYVGAKNVGGIAGENRTVFITKDGVVHTNAVQYQTRDKHGDLVVDPLTGLDKITGGGLIRDAYNDSQVTGWSNVGGVIGKNFGAEDTVETGDITATNTTAAKAYYISNAADVKGGDNVGGLVGVNNGILKGEEELTWREGLVRSEQKDAYGNKIYGMLTTSAASGIGSIDLDKPDALTNDQFTKLRAMVSKWNDKITEDTTDRTLVLDAAKDILTGLFHQKYIIGTSTAQTPDPQVLFGRNTGKIEAVRGMKQATEYNDAGVPTAFKYSTGTNVGGLIGISEEKGDVKYLLNGKASSVYGFQNVGGIIGKNEGILQESRNMMENNEISGIINVGGVVGENAPGGVIYSVKNDTKFNITVNKDYYDTQTGLFKKIDGTNTAPSATITVDGVDYDSPKYFGGVLGHNAAAAGGKDAGIVADAENYANVSVSGAEYVGGIIGRNEGTLAQKKQYIVLTGADKGKLKTIATDGAPSGTAGVDYYMVQGQYINYGAVGADLNTLIAENPKVNNYTPSGGTTIDITKSTTTIKVNKDTGEVAVTETNKNSQGQTVNETITRYVPGTSSYVGGIIGRNDANLHDVDLVNHASGFVMGKDYVGGIIGGNTGSITGARDDANTTAGDAAKGISKGNYYEDLVYNNGAIIATGQYAGGIAGQNTGNLTLAYNTGTVMSTGTNTGLALGGNSQAGNYVGGIVGQNKDGELSEVFSSITANDVIKGRGFVGGIAGQNAGTGRIHDTYSIGSVSGIQGNTGNLVGANSNTAADAITYSYSTSTNGYLIGDTSKAGVGTYTYNILDNTAYGSTGADGYLDEAQRKVGASYNGYADRRTGGTADGNKIWKFYDGQTTPILKNFLTNVYYTGDPDVLNFIYNGGTQGVLVKAIDTTNDGKYDKVAVYDKSEYVEGGNNTILGYIYSVDQKGTHADPDFLGTFTNDINTDLIIGNQNAKDAGEYTMFSSQQIKTIDNTDHGVNGLGVNNLGYNFVTLENKPATNPPDTPPTIKEEEITFDVKKKTLKLAGDTVYRVYGDAANVYNNSKHENPGTNIYGFKLKDGFGFVAGEEDLINGIIVGSNADKIANDEALTLLDKNKTKDATVTSDENRNYSWSDTATLNAAVSKNYTFSTSGGTLNEASYSGVSVVNRKKLDVTLNDFAILYGDKYGTGDGKTITVAGDGTYSRTTTSVKDAETTYNVTGLVYGDDLAKTLGTITIEDKAFVDRNGIKGSADVGNDYRLSISDTEMHSKIKDATNTWVTGGISKDQNYDVEIVNGTVDVVKKDVVIVKHNDPTPTEDPDKVYVYGDTVERTYGDDYIEKVTGSDAAAADKTANHNYGITVKNLADWDSVGDITLNAVERDKDGAVAGTEAAMPPGAQEGNAGVKETNNAGSDYNWTGSVNVKANIAKNYDIATGNEVSGDSIVNKKKITITLNDVVMQYGATEDGTVANNAYDGSLISGVGSTYKYDVTGITNGDVATNPDVIKMSTTGQYNNTGFTSDKWTDEGGVEHYKTDKVVWADAGLATDPNTNLTPYAAYKLTLNDKTITDGQNSSFNISSNYEIEEIVDGKVTITPAIIAAEGNTVYRTYGNTNITNSSDGSNNHNYATDSDGKAIISGWVYKENEIPTIATGIAGGLLNVDTTSIVDNALTGATTGAVTKDVGDYSWSGGNIAFSVSGMIVDGIDGTETQKRLAVTNNYRFWNYDDAKYAKTGTVGGKSVVEKADLTVKAGNAETIYGVAFDSSQYDVSVNGVVNGDSSDNILAAVRGVANANKDANYHNTQAFDGTGGKVTGDVGTHTEAITLTGTAQTAVKGITAENLNKNYKIFFDEGDAKITQHHIQIQANDVTMQYGATEGVKGDAENKNVAGVATSGIANQYSYKLLDKDGNEVDNINGKTAAQILGGTDAYNNQGFTASGTKDVVYDAAGKPIKAADITVSGVTLTDTKNFTYNAAENKAGDVVITPTIMSAGGNDIYRTYGSQTMYNKSKTEADRTNTNYADSVTVTVGDKTLDQILGANTIKNNFTHNNTGLVDGAVTGHTTGTANVGTYDWSSGSFTVNDAVKNTTLKNYRFWNGTDYALSQNVGGKSIVEKKDVYLTLNKQEVVYGNAGDIHAYGTGTGNVASGSFSDTISDSTAVNDSARADGATAADILAKINTAGGGYKDNGAKVTVGGEQRTGNVGTYNVGFINDVSDSLTNYDVHVTDGSVKITPREIYVGAVNATTEYGSTTMTYDTAGAVIKGSSSTTSGIVYGDDVTLGAITGANTSVIAGSDYATNRGSRTTADVKRDTTDTTGKTYLAYGNSLAINSDAAVLSGAKSGNYEIVGIDNGSITVTPVQVTAKLNDVSMIYGDKENTALYGYTFVDKDDHDVAVTNPGANGETLTADTTNNGNGLLGTVEYNNTGIKANGVTKDAGSYDLYAKTINSTGILGTTTDPVKGVTGAYTQNYDITIVEGDVDINKKTITLVGDPNKAGINANVVERLYGNANINNSYASATHTDHTTVGHKSDSLNTYGVQISGLVDDNGDAAANRNVALSGTNLLAAQASDTAIHGAGDAALTDGKSTNNAGYDYTWNSSFTLSDDLAKNYTFDTTAAGVSDGGKTIAVTGASEVAKRDLTITMNEFAILYGDKHSDNLHSVKVDANNKYVERNTDDANLVTTLEKGIASNTTLYNGDSIENVIQITGVDDKAFINRTVNGQTFNNVSANVGNDYGLYATQVTVDGGTTINGNANTNDGHLNSVSSNNYNITIVDGNVDVVATPVVTTDDPNPPTPNPDLIYVYGKDVVRTYGDATITNNNHDYTIDVFGNIADWDKAIDPSKFVDGKINVSLGQKTNAISDGAVDNLGVGKVTNNVGTYTWSSNIKATIDGILPTNYDIATGETVTANSYVTPADLWLQLGNFSVLYGDKYGDDLYIVNTTEKDGVLSYDSRDTIQKVVDAEKNLVNRDNLHKLTNSDAISDVITFSDTAKVINGAFTRVEDSGTYTGAVKNEVGNGYTLTGDKLIAGAGDKIDDAENGGSYYAGTSLNGNYNVRIYDGTVNVVARPVVVINPDDPEYPVVPQVPVDPADPDGPTMPDPNFDPDDPDTWENNPNFSNDIIYVYGQDVHRTYGNTDITQGDQDVHFIDKSGILNLDGMKVDKNGNEFDQGIVTKDGQKRTNNATVVGNENREYTWGTDVAVKNSDGSAIDTTNKNYALSTDKLVANSIVDRAKLDVTLNNMNVLYGDIYGENPNTVTVDAGKYTGRTDKALKDEEKILSAGTNQPVYGQDVNAIVNMSTTSMTGNGNNAFIPRKDADNKDIYGTNTVGSYDLNMVDSNLLDVQKDANGYIESGISADQNYDVTVHKGNVNVVNKPVVVDTPPDPDDPNNKDKVYIYGNAVERTYGDDYITSDGNDYGITVENVAVWDDPTKITLNPVTKDNDGAIKGTDALMPDTAVKGSSDKKETNDAGGYKWTGTVGTTGFNTTDYDMPPTDADGNITVKADSKVNKAQLVIDMNEFAVLYGDQYDKNENTVVKDANGNFDHRTTTSTQDAEKVIKVNSGSTLANGDTLAGVINMDTVNNSAFINRGTEENPLIGTADVKDGYGMTANTVKLDGTNTVTNVTTDEDGNRVVNSKNYEITINAGSVDVVSKPVVTLDPNDPGFVPPNPNDPTDWPKDPDGDPIPPWKPDPTDPTKPDPNNPFDPNDPGTWNPDFFDKDKIYVFGDDVERTYGNATINPNGNVHDYGITIKGEGAAWDKPLNEVITLNEVTKPNDGAIVGTTGNKVTNDVDKYTWNGTINVDDTSENPDEGAKPNYTIVTNGGNGTVSADSTVTKAKLDVYLNDFTILYGDERNENTLNNLYTVNKDANGNYESRTNVTLGQAENTFYNSADKDNVMSDDDVVNGDKLSDVINIAIQNGGFELKPNGVMGSLNAGQSGDLTGTDNKGNGNYDVTIHKGIVDVVAKPVVTFDPENPPPGIDPDDPKTFDPDKIYVVGNDVERTYGDATVTNKKPTDPDYTITIHGNGASWDKPLEEVITLNPVNKADDGAVKGTSGDKQTNDAGDYEWKGTINVNTPNNYDITTNGGNGNKVVADSTVNKAKLVIDMNDFAVLYGDKYADNENTVNVVNGQFGSRTDVKTQAAEKVISVNKDSALANGDTLDKVINMDTVNNSAFINRGTEENPLIGTADVKDGYGMTANTVKVDGSTAATAVGDDGKVESKNYEITINSGNVDVVSKPVVTIDPNDPDTWPTKPEDPTDPDGPQVVIPPWYPDPDDPTKPDPDHPFDPTDPDTWNPEVFDKDKIYVFGKDVERTYGNETINPKDPSTNPKDHDYGVTIKGNGAEWDKPVEDIINIKKDTINDRGLDTTGKPQGAVTNNVGDYTWNGAINVTDPKDNYTVVPNGKGDKVTAGSTVNKAQLVINLEDYKVLYGDIKTDDLQTITGSGNDFKRDGDKIGDIENKNWQNTAQGVANGDKIENILDMTTGTDAFTDRDTDKGTVLGTKNPGTGYTHNAGDNDLTNVKVDNGKTTGVTADGNYDVVINHGKVDVLAKPVIPIDPSDPETFPKDPDSGDPIKPYPPNPPTGFDPDDPGTYPPGFDPNDPGTWDPGIFDKDPDRIYVFGNTVNRTYGDTDINKTPDNPKGEYDVIVKGNGAAWDPDINDLINLKDPVETIVKTDGAILPDGEHTNNATVGKDPYHWNSGITVGTTPDNGYSIITNGGEPGKVQGNSTVDRAQLNIKLDDYKVLYGDVKGDDPHTIVIDPATGKPVRTDTPVSQVEKNWQNTATGVTNGDTITDILTMGTNTDAFINRGTDEKGNPILGTNNVGDGYGHTVGDNNMTGTSTSGNQTTGVSADGNYDVVIDHGNVGVVARPVTPINPNDPTNWPKDPNGNVIPPFTPDPNAPGYNPNDPGTWKPDPNKPYNPADPDTWNPGYRDEVLDPDKVIVVGDVVERNYGDETVINKPAGRPDYNIHIIGRPSWDNDNVVTLDIDPVTGRPSIDGALPNNPKPGIVTNDPGSYEWEGGLILDKNYQFDSFDNVVIADSIVHPRPEPIIVEDHHHEANNGDQRHWRERKAETNFTAGGGDFFNDNYENDGISHIFDDILEANMIDIRPDGTVEVAEYDEDGNLIADGEHVYDKEGNIVAGVSTTSDEDENENEEETEE